MSEGGRPRTAISVAVALVVVVAIVVVGIAAAGGGDEETTTSPPAEAPSRGAAPPGELPPEFVKCMADQGFDIEPSADIHSAPPEALQACIDAYHEGGGH
jgi:hypothetical protein